MNTLQGELPPRELSSACLERVAETFLSLLFGMCEQATEMFCGPSWPVEEAFRVEEAPGISMLGGNVSSLAWTLIGPSMTWKVFKGEC